ncbi:MAG: transposase [Bacteroidota bacterium]
MARQITDQYGLHFLTLTLVDWIDLFTRSAYSDLFLETLVFCQREKRLKVHAFVIMPSHVHLLVQATGNTPLAFMMKSIKSYSANLFLNYIQNTLQVESRREWLVKYLAFQARKNKRNSKHQIWMRGHYPVLLYSPAFIRQKLNYIHQNPVKARIVNDPVHYVYSSASYYETGEGVFAVDLLEDIEDNTGLFLS